MRDKYTEKENKRESMLKISVQYSKLKQKKYLLG
jgi:hypothetical protein